MSDRRCLQFLLEPLESNVLQTLEYVNRVYYIILHFDIKDGKIWLQQNTTDIDVGQELVDMGIPKTDIVLGLHPAYKRPYTGYGVA